MFSKRPRSLHGQLVAALDVGSDMRVLDLGCGHGASLPAIFEALGGDGHVIAVDRNKTALQKIRDHHSKAIERGSLECKEVDLSVQPLPFDDDLVDRILCQNVIECVVDKIALLNECYRILKPGGKLLLSHHDFDTAVFNSSYIERTRKLVHGFADTKQDWQDTSDGQIGRKLAGLLTASHFGQPTQRGTLLIDEYDYAPETYGYKFSQWASQIAAQAGQIPSDDLCDWHRDLEAKAATGSYYFCICLMAATGEKPR